MHVLYCLYDVWRNLSFPNEFCCFSFSYSCVGQGFLTYIRILKKILRAITGLKMCLSSTRSLTIFITKKSSRTACLRPLVKDNEIDLCLTINITQYIVFIYNTKLKNFLCFELRPFSLTTLYLWLEMPLVNRD
jgi:hypothetical protein